MFVLGPEPTRLNVVEDNAYALVTRAPRAYRALKLFDLGDDRVDSIAVTGEKGTFRLEENVGTTNTTFALTEPVKADADQEKAKNLLKDLAEPAGDRVPARPAAAGRRRGDARPARPARAGGRQDRRRGRRARQADGRGDAPLHRPEGDVAADALHRQAARRQAGIFRQARRLAERVRASRRKSPRRSPAGRSPCCRCSSGTAAPTDVTAVEVKRGTEPPYALSQTGGTWKITAPFDTRGRLRGGAAARRRPGGGQGREVRRPRGDQPGRVRLRHAGLRIKFTLTERKVNKPGEEPKEETKERVLVVGKAGGGRQGPVRPPGRRQPGSVRAAGGDGQGPRQSRPWSCSTRSS